MHYQAQYYGGANVLLKSINHKALHGLGLAVWQPRPFRHPEKFHIVPQQIRINARCLVVLFCENNNAVAISKEQKTILNGMLSVLELPANDIMLATIYADSAASPDLRAIAAVIGNWMPQYILQLSMELPELNVGPQCIQTYSPEYLLQNKQYKAQAYKSLLNLRAMLNGTS